MSLFLYQDGSRPHASGDPISTTRTFCADYSSLPASLISPLWDASAPVRAALFFNSNGNVISRVSFVCLENDDDAGDNNNNNVGNARDGDGRDAVSRVRLQRVLASPAGGSWVRFGVEVGGEENGPTGNSSECEVEVLDMVEVGGSAARMCAACRTLAVAECGRGAVVLSDDDDETMDGDSTPKSEIDASLKDWIADALDRKIPSSICAHFASPGNSIPPCVGSVAALGSRHLLHGARGAHPMLRFSPSISTASFDTDRSVVLFGGRCLGGDIATRVAITFRSSSSSSSSSSSCSSSLGSAGVNRCVVEPLAVGTRQLAFRWPAEIESEVASGAAVVCEVCVVADRSVPGGRAPPVRLASEPIVWRIEAGGAAQGRVDARPSRIGAAFMGHLCEADLWRAPEEDDGETTLTTEGRGDPLTAVVTGGFVAEGIVQRTLRQGDLTQWCSETDSQGHSNLAVAMYLWPAAVCYPLAAQCEPDFEQVAVELAELELKHGLPPASLADPGSASLMKFVFAARDAESFVQIVESGRIGDLIGGEVFAQQQQETATSTTTTTTTTTTTSHPPATAISKAKGVGYTGEVREKDTLMARYMRWMMA